MNTKTTNKTGEGNAPRTLSTCKHCGRGINLRNGVWIDPQAKGDDAMWSETCDSHDTFTAEHEPVLVKQDANTRDVHNETRPAQNKAKPQT